MGKAKHRAETATGAGTAAAASARRGRSSETEGRRREGRSARGQAQGLREQNAGHPVNPSPSSDPPRSTASSAKTRANFLETSATLLAAQRWTRAGLRGTASSSAALDSGRPSATTAGEVDAADEVPTETTFEWKFDLSQMLDRDKLTAVELVACVSE